MCAGKGCIHPGLAVTHSLGLLPDSPWGIACFSLLGVKEHLALASAPEGKGMPPIFGWECWVEVSSGVGGNCRVATTGVAHTVCHPFLFCSGDSWTNKWLQPHALSFVRHYSILLKEVFKLLSYALCHWRAYVFQIMIPWTAGTCGRETET